MCAFVVLGLVFPYQAERLAWGTSSKSPILCRVGHKATTQSVISNGFFLLQVEENRGSPVKPGSPEKHGGDGGSVW